MKSFAIFAVIIIMCSIALAHLKIDTFHFFYPTQLLNKNSYTVAIFDSKNTYSRQGTGFAIDKNIIATNFHIVKEFAKIDSHLECEVVANDAIYRKCEILGFDKTHDIALLKVKTPLPSYFELSKQNDLSASEVFYGAGSSYSTYPYFWTGQFLYYGTCKTAYSKGARCGVIYAPIWHGTSGGPIINKSGRVVGMAAELYKDNSGMGAFIDINILIPIIEDIRKKGSSYVSPVHARFKSMSYAMSINSNPDTSKLIGIFIEFNNKDLQKFFKNKIIFKIDNIEVVKSPHFIAAYLNTRPSGTAIIFSYYAKDGTKLNRSVVVQ